MAQFELLMPKLGESVEEATITKWFVKEGDMVEDDDVLLEIATDKVDSEIPSPVTGKVIAINYKQDETVPVGTVIALIDTDVVAAGEKTEAGTGERTDKDTVSPAEDKPGTSAPDSAKDQAGKGEPGRKEPVSSGEEQKEPAPDELSGRAEATGRFYSPLVRKIAAREQISPSEMDSIKGTGINGRVRKQDLLAYIAEKKPAQVPARESAQTASLSEKPAVAAAGIKPGPSVQVFPGDEVIEMDRVRKLIAEHMVMSKRVSPHVTNMIEADVTEIVLWRNRVKEEFFSREKEKITYLPVFIEATIRALKDYPRINASVDGDRIIIRGRVNMGIAVALPEGNLIVPVIKDADQLNLLGMTKMLNSLAARARNNRLSPDDIQGGTFTITNFGTFRNVMGTPIINQPQAAILAVGTIEKKPAVIETPTGDIIGIRHRMFLSLSYDHRIIDGAYGGAFLRKLADYLESFDGKRTI